MTNNIRIEICLDSVESARNAAEGGAHRVELCDNLFEGGTTPSFGTIRHARRSIDIGMNVIIRPRGGDFCYSGPEFEVMKDDIRLCKDEGADGVVIGILTSDGKVDIKRTARLVELARPMSVTFHRAFDMTADPLSALEEIISLGCDRILTSGQEASVPEGIDLIAQLVKTAGDRIIIMPGGGITERNFEKVVERSGAKEFHIYAHSEHPSAMQFRSKHVFMGGELRPPEFSNRFTDPFRVKTYVTAVRQIKDPLRQQLDR
jgi:copper homeostasis protein